ASSGMDESTVTLVEMDVDAMPEQLRKKQIDAFAAWEPTPTWAVFQDNAQIVYRFLSSGYVYFAPSVVQDHPEAVRILLAAQIRALTWLDQSEANLEQGVDWGIEEMHKLLNTQEKRDRDELVRLTMRGLRNLSLTPLLPEDDRMPQGRLAKAVAFLRKIDKIPRDASWESVSSCFHPELVETVLLAPTQYQLDLFDYRQEVP
ncbi:MAG: ABC transporter substrate-binding protein, partial [Magnetococcales bacterium]|nr:ABC transporter substrate-binding protein [Magnetococcales bacterium]